VSGRLRFADASIRIDSMPPAGRDLALSLDTAECEALAAELALTAVDRLEARLHAVRFRGGFRVTGRLEAAIVQPSVISLEPVRQDIAEPVDRVFLPLGDKDVATSADAEIFVDVEGEDVPDHFEGNEADLSELLVETLSLAVDPYPRRPDESLEDIGLAADDEPDNPFAALKALKTPPDKG
jgi:hypothetical protein